MTAYALYNEIDPFAAAWLEQLIARGLIAPGVVDRRSIEDICPDDLRGFRQVHFFAGIGVWSYALRRAGVPDDANVWTGSCPCQPFSAAGKGGGVDDERHLWPHFHHLIRECRPALVFGEQVASKDGLAWLDLVHADMETSVYAFGAVDTCAAGLGAPHIRQRLYWFGERMADASRIDGRSGLCDLGSIGQRWPLIVNSSSIDGMDHHHKQRLERQRSGSSAEAGHREGPLRPVAKASESGRLADGTDVGRFRWRTGEAGHEYGSVKRSDGFRDACRMAHANLIDDDRTRPDAGTERGELFGSAAISGQSDTIHGGPRRTGPTNGFWADADWLHCRDERWRPVEPFTFPLAHGAAARVGRLRGYGNAINAEQAIGFLDAFFEAKAIEVAPIHETTRNLDARSLTAELLGGLL